MSSPLRIAIVGGGIGGLSLAVGLARGKEAGANIEVSLFEAAEKFKEIGAGVGLGPNAYCAIRMLGLEEPYKALTATDEEVGPDGVSKYFRWRYGETDRIEARGGDDFIGQTLCSVKGGHTTVHRAKFLDMLIDHLPEGVATFHKRLQTYSLAEGSGEAPVTLFFEDSTSYEADILIACDGVKSPCRSILLKGLLPPSALKPKFTGTVAFRGLVPMEALVEIAGEDVRHGTMFLGKGKHILIFPILHGTVLNIVAFSSNREEANHVWGHDAWIVPGDTEEMLKGWEGWSDQTKMILKAITKTDKWALHELEDLPSHAIGNVAIIGDAAHATLPHQGQGAGQSIEDAVCLASLLCSPGVTPSNAHLALSTYSELRKTRTTAVKNTSRELGEVLEFEDGAINGEKVELKKNLMERYNWLWEWNGEEEVKEGQRILSEKMRV